MKWYRDGDGGYKKNYGKPLDYLPKVSKFYRYNYRYNNQHTCFVCGLRVIDHGRTGDTDYIQICPGDEIVNGDIINVLHNPVYGRTT
jgi:hypothetical protein